MQVFEEEESSDKQKQGPRRIRVYPANKSELCNEFLRTSYCTFREKFGFNCPYAHSVDEAKNFVREEKKKYDEEYED